MVGKHAYAVAPDEARALMDRLRSQDLWSMAGNWVAPVEDYAVYNITLTVGDQSRTITDYYGEAIGMPAAVTEAEDDIDRAGQVDGWLKLSAAKLDLLEAEHFPFASQAGADLLARAVDDDEAGNDTALLRLMALGAPLTGVDRNALNPRRFMAPSLLDPALEHHHKALIQPLIDKGLLMTDGAIDPAKLNSAFQSAIIGGRMDLVDFMWSVGGPDVHPGLMFKDTSRNYGTLGETTQESPVTLLLSRAWHDDGWEGDAIARWLLAKGCDVKARAADGHSLLQAAVEADDKAMVSYLLAQGADVSAPVAYDRPILRSVEADEDMAMLLIEAGADLYQLSSDQGDFRRFAVWKGWTRVVAWMDAHSPAKP